MNSLSARPRTVRPTAARPKPTEPRSWKRIVGASLALVLIISASVWAWRHYSHLARLRKAGELIAAAQNHAGQPGSSSQRGFGLDDGTRQAIDALGLTQAERDELSAARREEARRRAQENMDRYLAMSERERQAYMQKQVADMAKQFDKNAASSKTSDSSSGNNAKANGTQGQAGGARPQGPRTPDRRLQAQKWRLDNSTPQQRAQRTIYINDLTKAIGAQNNARLAQGLPPLPLPRPRSM